MDAFVIVIIIVCAGIVFPALVLCCVLTHRGKKPLKSQPRDLEMSKIGIKDGGLVVLTRNVSASAAVAAAVTTVDSAGGGDCNGCCCGGGDDGGGDGGGGCGGCGGCGG
ncbi:short stature homeobox protein 2-like isoform X1 [Eutrema salsugineum]|uniref:short stature homeobox protein 2-like isoform X1 n=1 Tax=Eutrema salsugineum TaxID=72664 RepID=UPI000CECF104|nr:short stature homeobox protein 2-like isoform X1 [Eutrema salsugineum]